MNVLITVIVSVLTSIVCNRIHLNKIMNDYFKGINEITAEEITRINKKLYAEHLNMLTNHLDTSWENYNALANKEFVRALNKYGFRCELADEPTVQVNTEGE